MRIKKIFQVLRRKIIFKYDGLNNAVYMKKYNKFLKKNGVDIIGAGPDYISSSAYLDAYNYKNIHIGEKSVISKDVLILTHDFSIRTGLFMKNEWSDIYNYHFEKKVYIGNNVFIGVRAVILPGTVINDNVIIGAGAVVRGVIDSNSVVVGNPAICVSKLDEWTMKHEEDSIIKNKIF